ncbi:MAG TPA: hypothetical protein VGQ65_14405 [Thermoanaerobaculia bacterium]|jgi:hypothetical protein|nr:hypothetical protein [Thermoanaerobaculia bacterium]
MKTLRPLCAALLLLITFNAFAADPTLPELFKRAKDKFAAGDYKGGACRSREVRFDFVTREGYGSSVMQKDSEPMQTLGIAADAARRDKKLNG